MNRFIYLIAALLVPTAVKGDLPRDAAHNLSTRASGALTMEQVFWCDAANQLTNEVLDGGMLIAGATASPATNFSVGTQPGQVYSDLTFACTNAPLGVTDGTTNYLLNLQFRTGLGMVSPYTVIPPPSVTLQYDNNGNLTNDGTRSFAYSAENQMTSVQVAGSWRTDFVYDGLGRRRIERNFTWQSGSWSKTNELHFIYDGWLLVQVRDANNNVLVTYTRGLDLSGTLAGAGGIGGLLARTDTNGSTFYHSDGEGNVTALIDGQEDIVARYLYDPFGRLLGQWGALASANEMQFSSMPHHANSGLSLYAFRAYDPTLPRWLNRDPSGEISDVNLYRAMANSPVNVLDRNGRDNIYNMGAGNNNVPAMTITGPASGGPATASYPGGGLGDPLFDIAAMTIGGMVIPAPGAAAEASGLGPGDLAVLLAQLLDLLKSDQAPNDAGLQAGALSDYKKALREVHCKVGKLPKGKPGKFGSPQRGGFSKRISA